MTWPRKFNWVAAVEGVDTLLTDAADTDAVLTAWAASRWGAGFALPPGGSCVSGLFVYLNNEQSAHPWEPFTGGGALKLAICNESIGALMHRTAGGGESELALELDRDDQTISVKSTSSFPSSGYVHIGTEAIGYESTDATTFINQVRAEYMPFDSGAGLRYTHDHRIGYASYAPNLMPKVTQYPREWIGRWVGLWRHGYEEDGTMQTKANATLVFAGRIVEVRDDPRVLGTVIEVEHVLTYLKNQTIGRDMFSASIGDGIYLPAGATFKFKDFNGTSWKTATNLVVVASGASGSNEMDAGFYTATQLFNKLNAWWAPELAASRIYGSYSIAQATTNNTPDSIRTKIYWYIPGSNSVAFKFTLPKQVATFLGFNGSPPTDSGAHETVGDTDSPNTNHHFYKEWVPLRAFVSTGLTDIRLRLENLSGAFQDQLATLPEVMKAPYLDPANQYGLFMFDDKVLVRARFVDNGDGTYELWDVSPPVSWWPGNPQTIEALTAFCKRVDDPSLTKIKQVFLFEMQAREFIKRLLYSTGTAGFNHATYDDLPWGVGVDLPGALLGAAFETSCDNMPGADKPVAPMIDKPTKISSLIASDLVLRHVFPVWKNGGIRMATWQTPASSLAVAALTEANKAEPAGNKVEHRGSTILSDRFAKPVIKIRYNRSLTKETEYTSTINVEDATAVDDGGNRGEPFTIDARNTFTEFVQTGSAIEDIVPNIFIPPITMFTKPMYTLRRSISPDYYEGYAPGDIVTVTDKFARDPSTGRRLVSAEPAAVVRFRWSLDVN